MAVSQDQDLAPDPILTKADGLIQRGRGKMADPQGLQMGGHRLGSMAIGVGLDHAHDLAALRQQALVATDVVSQGLTVQFNTGTVHGAVSSLGSTHGLFPARCSKPRVEKAGLNR